LVTKALARYTTAPMAKKDNKKRSKSASKAPLSYASAGVDIDAGDRMVDMIKSHMRRTYGPRVLGLHGAFAGCFRLDYNEKLFKRNYRDPVLVGCTDGVGSKVLLACKMGIHDTVGQDCVAMNVNDLIVQGAEPLFFLDYIGTQKLDPAHMTDIVKGVADGCELADCALLGGETAELADVYKSGEYDLAGFCVGVCELKRVLDGSRVEQGDVILGLGASGVHSNGFTLVRAIVDQAKLNLKKIYPEVDPDQTLGQVLLTPTRIYVKSIVSILRRYKVKQVISGMAHITGGGLGGNINRSLGAKLNARLRRKAWEPLPIFRFLQEKGGIEDQEMMRVFNMGIGYVLMVKPHFAKSVAKQLERHGEQVSVLGKVTSGSGKVVWA
jgi:phosphoribosylformylglycinamidine cyclo-ligase